jgi:hypothetical protein
VWGALAVRPEELTSPLVEDAPLLGAVAVDVPDRSIRAYARVDQVALGRVDAGDRSAVDVLPVQLLASLEGPHQQDR